MHASLSSPSRQAVRRRAFACAFPKTLPILAGFLFLGMSYGIYARVKGFDFWYPMLTSVAVFGGSLEFVTVSLLLDPFAPARAFLLALMIQARHLFYGLTMLEKYKGTGWKKPFLIFGMCDETFSVICASDPPADVDKGWFMLFITLLDQFYWITGTTIGGLLGGLITFNAEGLDFVMTAMFAVIFLEQWLKEKRHYTALIGLGAAMGCLFLFGADSFLIPTMVSVLALLTIFRKPIEKAGDAQ